jgi:hypothetical protein
MEYGKDTRDVVVYWCRRCRCCGTNEVEEKGAVVVVGIDDEAVAANEEYVVIVIVLDGEDDVDDDEVGPTTEAAYRVWRCPRSNCAVLVADTTLERNMVMVGRT